MKNKATLKGKEYWRSLDQLAETPEFKEVLQREFPDGAAEMGNPLTRRTFLSLMGASLAFAGLASCRRPVEKIIPYVTAPENIIPGIPQYFATTMPFGLSAYGILVESHEGRPTKIEGNEQHPSSLGKSNAFVQAAILGLYDPDRSPTVLHDGKESDWAQFVSFWQQTYKKYSEQQGEGLAVLSESFASPTLFRLHQAFMKQFPKAKWHVYEAVSDENLYEGLKIACGQAYQPIYHYEKAKVILSLEADFLLMESGNITANKGFAAGRRMLSERDEMNRLYMVENNLSITGGMADHRLRLRNSEVAAFAVALARELKQQALHLEFPIEQIGQPQNSFDEKWLKEVAKDLLANRGKSLIIAGRRQPPPVHGLVFALNQALGNIGVSVDFKPLRNALLPSTQSIIKLAENLKAGQVSTLVILGGNPLYNAPADLNFAENLKRAQTTIHMSAYVDETSRSVTWHLPQTHFLESWGDAQATDGTLSVIQPLIEPLFKGRSVFELMELLTTGAEKSGYDIVRETWQAILPKEEFETSWRKTLHDGLLENSAAPSLHPQIESNTLLSNLKEKSLISILATADNLEIVFQASPAVFDGRFANNGWLQELPDAVTKLTWDNALLLSPMTAKQFNLKNEDVVELSYNGRTLRLPIWIQPGHADFSLTVTLGYGRSGVGRIADSTGFDLYPMRQSAHPDFAIGAHLSKTGEIHKLACTQDHGSMEGRPLVREGSLDEYRKHPHFAKEMVEHPPLKSLWDEHPYDAGYQWGMSIDLNACSGCNACVIACQSENNIPIIGKEQTRNGREMHWLRLDRYYAGELSAPQMVFQPVACQHCENAPCEQVCPVQATSHDHEGLNVMTYNRCIGTRYCSNNCPYKVRRFNFFNYTKDLPEVLKMAQNPDVTVRSRGVMEKCTYCTQRLNEAKISAKNAGRTLTDGEVQTACQQTCPANAIIFGNILDPDSEVSKIKKLNRDYTMLGELNMKTRTTYLAKLRNPNPALGDGRGVKAEG